jgi:hypothetical protein
VIRVLVPRPVADALLPKACDNRYCDRGTIRQDDGRGVGYCVVCGGSGSLPPLLTWLVVEGEWPKRCPLADPEDCNGEHCDCPLSPPDLVRAIESGERIGIGIEVEVLPAEESTYGAVSGTVLVGSVRPTEVLPVRTVLGPYDGEELTVAYGRQVWHGVTDVTAAMSLYGDPVSLVGRFAVACEDARREG